MADPSNVSVDSVPPSKLLLKKRESSNSSRASTVFSRGSMSPPKLQILRRWLNRPETKRECLYWATLVVGFLQLAIKIASLVIHCEVRHEETPHKAAWIVFCSINIFFVSLVLTIYLLRRYYHRRHWLFGSVSIGKKNDDTEKLIKSKKSEEKQPLQANGLWFRLEFLVNVIVTAFMVVSSVIFLANTSSHILALPKYSRPAALAVGFEATDCALTVTFFILDMLYECSTFAMIAQALAMLMTLLNFLVAIICIWSNEYSRIYDNSNWNDDRLDAAAVLSHVRAFSYFGVVIGFANGIGFVSSMVLDASNRLSNIGTTLSSTYVMSSVVSLIIAIVYFSMSCKNIQLFMTYQWSLRNVLIANICTAGASMLLSFFGILAMLKVRQRPSTDLQVEEYDLNKLNDDQLAVWIRLINTYHKQESRNPDTAAGFEALSLFKAYSNNPMPNLKCRVLRVYDAGEKAYEKIKAWDNLDHREAFDAENASIIDNKEAVINEPTEDKNNNQAPAKLSKNAAKRAKLKAAKKAAKNGDNAATNVAVQLQQSPEEIRRDIAFRNDLISTEALVLLTCIEDYDLLSSIKGTWYGDFLCKLIGSDSPLKLTCIRFGLLATHWPFRQSMLFTSHTRKPNARAAAVCRAIAAYNSSLPKSKRCSMILNPTVAHLGVEQVLKPSGWLSVPLPPSHVVDLRPYKNYTLTDYLKKIKYRDQSKAFKRANGEVIETLDFDQNNCRKAMDLWWNIACKRVADGNTSVLANPTPELLQCLGNVSNEKGSRSLLFLKVDGVVIASAVLFRLGDTITSDIQGLDHDLARQYNAYFVMMQETIDIALKSGLKFVDFGPTTSQPKMAIGCKEVEIYGGIFVRAPLSWFVTIFSGSVQVDE